MNVTNDSYGVSQYYNNTVQRSNTSTSRSKLSNRAQAFLEKLKKTYSNMDFMVADFDKGDNAKEILSRCTKEISVMFSSEELEKMASDEKYAKEYMDRVQGALRMSEQINQQFGFSFNKDGTMSIFAELEKAMKKTTIQASSVGDLLKKISETAWSHVGEDKKSESNRVDISI